MRIAMRDPMATAMQTSIIVQRVRQVISGTCFPYFTMPVTLTMLQTAMNAERDRKANTLSFVESFIGDFINMRIGMLTTAIVSNQ